MTLAVITFFRNSAIRGQVAPFFTQAARLRNILQKQGFAFRVIAVWGDCVDDTYKEILRNAEYHNLAVQTVEHNHGQREFGSTEHPDRMVALSALGNAGLEAVREGDTAVFYVESDLVWDPHTVISLLNRLNGEVHVVAPLIFAGEHFYDVFCFRKNGHRFAPFYPYHSELRHDGNLTQVDSVGSALVMHGEVARHCRIINDNVLMGFCQDCWNKGFTVNVDASQKVVHP